MVRPFVLHLFVLLLIFWGELNLDIAKLSKRDFDSFVSSFLLCYLARQSDHIECVELLAVDEVPTESRICRY